MILVSDIYDEAKEIFGHCEEKKLLRWITDAVQLLANKGEVDPLVGLVDICVHGRCVTLPREVETVLAVNICGRPTRGRDEQFSFHLNGPGEDCGSCDYSWVNEGNFFTYRDIQCPVKLVAFVENQEDEGAELRVFGFDEQNRPLRTNANGVWSDGLLVPTIFNYALPSSTDPLMSRITGIVKSPTVANLRLSSFDNSTSTGTLLGIFEPDETQPQYRRIRLNHSSPWVRIMYRKRSLELTSQGSRILLHSRPALLLAMHALKKYREADLGTAVQFEAQATRLLTERENVLTAPISSPMQVEDRSSIKLRCGEDLD
jgi:hypothetical protein